MGLEDLTTSVLTTLNLSTVDTEELLETFNKSVNSPIIEILFDALSLCKIQGGISWSQYFETWTSWLYIPKLLFIPFHHINHEANTRSSKMNINTQEIMTFQQQTREKYKDYENIQNDPNISSNIKKVLNLDTTTTPDYGIVEYKNFLKIDAEYWMGKQEYIIDTQFIKVGFPNMLKFLRITLDSLPYSIPVYFYSEKTGGISKPWMSNRLIPSSLDTSNNKIESKQVYTLHKFDYDTNSKNNKIRFKIELLGSIFGLYDDPSANNLEEKIKKMNEEADKVNIRPPS